MDKLHVQGPTKLQGEVTISDARNAALPILFVTLLVEEPVEIQNVPKLEDVDTSMRLLNQLGAKAEHNGPVYVDARDTNVFCVPYDLVKTICASIWALGPLVTRFGQEQVSLPGGCTVGVRLTDLHISGLEQLGVTIKPEEGYVKTFVDGRLKGAYIVVDKASVDATVTIMCAATLAEGTTIIGNVARKPKIIDTANFLITLDAKISDQGTGCIVIGGVERLGDGVYRVLPDRIEISTLPVTATISRDRIICRSAQPDTLDAILVKLCDAGAGIEVGKDWISLDMRGKRPKAVNVRTTSYLTFPTDMQAQFTLLNLMTEGIRSIVETAFENRSMYVLKSSRMDAHAEVESNTVICHSVEKLSDAQAMATNLYASADLMLAGCIAEETTVVDRVYHIDRGYERIKNKLRALGANIGCVRDE